MGLPPGTRPCLPDSGFLVNLPSGVATSRQPDTPAQAVSGHALCPPASGMSPFPMRRFPLPASGPGSWPPPEMPLPLPPVGSTPQGDLGVTLPQEGAWGEPVMRWCPLRLPAAGPGGGHRRDSGLRERPRAQQTPLGLATPGSSHCLKAQPKIGTGKKTIQSTEDAGGAEESNQTWL